MRLLSKFAFFISIWLVALCVSANTNSNTNAEPTDPTPAIAQEPPPATEEPQPKLAKGPNEGFLQNAGDYRVELKFEIVLFKVWLHTLYDFGGTTDNSSAQLIINSQGKSSTIQCISAGDHFICTSPRTPKKDDEIRVISTRNSIKGQTVRYIYPLDGKTPPPPKPAPPKPKKKRKKKTST